MNPLHLFSLLAVISTAVLRGEDEIPIYLSATETEALLAKEGQKVIVHGETTDSGKSPSGANFVNFKDSEFYLVTFKSDLEQFAEGEPAELFDGKRIAVEGVVSIYQDKPQIKLTRPDQVTLLAADDVFPPETKPREEKTGEKKPAVVMEEPEEKPAEEEPKRKPPVDASEFFD